MGIGREIGDRHRGLIAQQFCRDPLHIGGGDLLQRGEPAIGLGWIVGKDHARADQRSATLRGLALLKRLRDDHVADAIHLLLAGGGVADAGDLLAQRRLALGRAVIAGHDREGGERASALLEIGDDVGLAGDLVAIDQILVQAAAVAARQDAVDHVDRGMILVVQHGQ